MKFKRLFVACLCLISIGLVVINTFTNAKYYTTIVTQVWKTNFTYYGVVNPGDVKFRYTIDAQSADNPPSMFDGNEILNHNEADAANNTKNRWTNWSSSGTNKGEDARIIISFVKPVYMKAIRLYYFLDNAGCDIPRDLTVSYVASETGKSINVINDKSLTELDNSFDVASSSGRTSIFRDQSGGVNSGGPLYYDKATQKDVSYVQTNSSGGYVNMEPPYTTVYFKSDKSQVCLTSLELHMQAGENWYIGLTEFAMDWIYADYDPNTDVLEDNSSPWYGSF